MSDLDRYRDAAGRLWCAIAAEHRQEPFARDNLEAAGFDCWWPHFLANITRRVGTVDRKLTVLRGLFSGYLFAAVDDPREVETIDRTRGVAVTCRTSAGPAFVRPEEFTAWRAKGLNAEGLHEPPPWAHGLQRAAYAPSDRIKLTGGHAFAGFMAEVRRVVGERVDFELEELIWGHRVKGTADACQVERATP
jgi:transcription antitermination factor NusG